MQDIMQSLHQEHANLAKVLTVLEDQIKIFGEGEPPDYDLIHSIVRYVRDYPDLFHHPKEDLIYEKLTARNPDLRAAVGAVREEHEILLKLSERLEELMETVVTETMVPRDAVIQVVREYVDTTRRHMEDEERSFFPTIERTLTAADWDDVNARAAAYEDPLFGAEIKGKFQDLAQEILRVAREDA